MSMPLKRECISLYKQDEVMGFTIVTELYHHHVLMQRLLHNIVMLQDSQEYLFPVFCNRILAHVQTVMMTKKTRRRRRRRKRYKKSCETCLYICWWCWFFKSHKELGLKIVCCLFCLVVNVVYKTDMKVFLRCVCVCLSNTILMFVDVSVNNCFWLDP